MRYVLPCFLAAHLRRLDQDRTAEQRDQVAPPHGETASAPILRCSTASRDQPVSRSYQHSGVGPPPS